MSFIREQILRTQIHYTYSFFPRSRFTAGMGFFNDSSFDCGFCLFVDGAFGFDDGVGEGALICLLFDVLNMFVWCLV